MKHLKPSHREKKRYLLIAGTEANKKAIDEAILEYVGILGYAKASPKVILTQKDKLILAINRKELDKVRAAFILSGKKIQVKKISGSIKNLKDE
jgi:RNase P/RNase MRP subunit POP5